MAASVVSARGNAPATRVRPSLLVYETPDIERTRGIFARLGMGSLPTATTTSSRSGAFATAAIRFEQARSPAAASLAAIGLAGDHAPASAAALDAFMATFALVASCAPPVEPPVELSAGARPETPLSLFQLGCVVGDVEAAVAALSARFGLASFHVLRGLVSEQSGGNVRLDAALAYWGGLVVELIAPDADAPSIYRDFIPPRPDEVRFHHLGFLARDPAALADAREFAAASGWPCCIEFVNDAVDCLYVDARADLGHYLEFVHRKPAGWAMYENVPRN